MAKLSLKSPAKWSQLFPNGRTVFYEGDDPKGFVREMKKKYGFDPSKGRFWNKKNGYQFHCPAECMDEVYGNYKYPLGS